MVTLCLVIKFYDTLRIFKKPAFYIELIAATIRDIRPFMLLYIASLVMFAVPVTMQNFYRFED